MENYLFGKKIAYLSLGCKVNGYETEAIKEHFKGFGAEEVAFSEFADVYLINTCTVTNIADRKSRQMLRRARKVNPDAVVVATGCYVQEFFRNHEEDDLADIYVGNRRKSEIAQILNGYYQACAEGGKVDRFYVNEDKELVGYEDMISVTTEGHTRAFMKIQDGCNQFCSYCIIPFARGRISSRSEEEILKEAKLLSDSGYREIVVTGIHLSSYGLETLSLREQAALRPDKGELPLLLVLRRLAEIPGIERIRLGSLEPRIITEDFARELSKIEKVCPHFHLSLQSGCDKTLRAMNRKYTTAEYAVCVDILRKYFDRPAITTDMIVGFPGESEEDFNESASFAERIRFAQIHVFPYSRRKGTVADRMSGQHTDAVKRAREAVLLTKEHALRSAYAKQFLGTETEVVVEELITEDGITKGRGHDRRYLLYTFPLSEDLSGQIVTVIGTSVTTDCTIQAKKVDISHKIG